MFCSDPAVCTARSGRGRLVHRLQRLGGVDGVGHDAAAGLDVGAAFAEQGRADGDGHVHVAGEVQVAHHAAVDAAAVRFELVEQAQRAGLGRAGQRAGRERGLEDVVGLGVRGQLAHHGGHQVHDVAEPLHLHELGDVHGSGHADLGEVVARQVHQHQVLGAFLLVGQQLLGQGLVRLHGLARGAGNRRWGG